MNLKKWGFLCLLLGLSAVFAAEKIKPAGYDFTAPTLKGQEISADPNRTKLIDGILESPSRVIWRYKEAQTKSIRIEFTFGNPVKLESTTVHYFRGKRSYGIKSINVFGIDGEGAQFPLGGVSLNQPYELPDGEPSASAAEIKLESDKPVSKAIMEFHPTGGYLGLCEIEFMGTADKTAAEPVSAGSLVNPYNSYASEAASGLQLRQEKDLVILENNQVLYVLDPTRGGCVNFAYDKKAKFNFIKFGDKSDYGGMFNDRFWPGSYDVRDMFRGVAYQVEIVDNGPERKSVKLSANGKSGIFTNVTVEKTFVLDAVSPVLRVDYRILNDQVNVVPLNHGFWSMGGLCADRQFTLIYPGSSGIEKNPCKAQSLFCPGAVRGWCAGITAEGKGLALICDYELLKSFYFWSNNDQATTIEARLGVYPINANDNLRTSFALAPFSGIGTPDNVNRVMAGGFNLSADLPENTSELQFQLLPFTPGRYELRIMAGKLSRGKIDFQTLHQGEINAAATPLKVAAPFKPSTGTWIFKAVVLAHGEEVFEAIASSVYKQSSGVHMMEAECKKRPESGEQAQELKLNFNSMEHETPHIKWARPYAGKTPEVLAVCRRRAGIRDMIEVAQRVDIKLTTSYIGGIWQISGLTTSLNEKDAYNELAKQLKHKFDSIVVASDMWAKMPANVRDAILNQVREGTGLVLIAPEGLPPELDKQFKIGKNDRHFTGEWSMVKENAITAGVPFGILPATRALAYESSGEVLAQIGRNPLLATFNYGKGKVVAAAWATDGRSRSGYYTIHSDPTILPLMLYNMPENMNYHYWEYQISLLGKMIYWSADCQSGISGGNLRVEPGRLSVELTAAAPGKVTAELVIRDKFSRVEQTVSETLELKEGKNSVELKFASPIFHGVHLADLVIKSAKGTEWWGSASFDIIAPTSIKSLKLADKVWKKEESLSGNLELAAPGKVRIALYDNHGNQFAAGDAAVFQLPLADCRTLTCRLVAEVESEGRIVDRLERDVALFGKPDPRRLLISFGWPSLSMRGTQEFLLNEIWQVYRQFGTNALSIFRTDTPLEIQVARKNNLAIIASSAPGSAGGKTPYDSKAKINSKLDLVRTPCLSAPGFKDTQEKLSAGSAPFEDYGVLFRAGGDETNSISSWEGCFSADCRREFRVWLQKVYGSLDELNKSWLTAYKSWDEVVAMTSAEVRNHGSYAPWVDHRAFNDWNRADTFARIVKGMKRQDPGLRYSLSGTQEPNAFNAWEWYQLMPSLEALQSYEGEQSIMQRCFASKMPLWQTWLGYDESYSRLSEKALRRMMLGATGFCIYGSSFYLNPDYTVPPRGKDMIRVLDTFRNGTGELIINSDFAAESIAMLYSPGSIKVDWILNADDFRRGSIRGCKLLLNDMGLGYDYVASAQLENSTILRDKYKLLILPLASAMSDKELEAVREFVKNGGTVIADMLSGSYNQHGLSRKAMPLADVFGLKSEMPSFSIRDAELSALDVNAEGLALPGMKMTVKAFESGIVPDTAKALAQISVDGKKYPAITVNRFGKGLAIYLGAALPGTVSNLAEMRYTEANQKNLQPINGLLWEIMRRLEIQPVAQAPTLKSANIMLRSQGPAYVLGIGRNSAEAANLDPKPAVHRVQLHREYHVYDLVKQQYLTHGKEFDYEFGPDTQGIFMLLPYQPGKPELQIAADGAKRTVRIQLPVKAAEYANHLYRVEVKSPDGKINPAYSEIIFGQGPQAEYSLKLPLNSVPGKWHIKVTEVISRESSEAEL